MYEAENHLVVLRNLNPKLQKQFTQSNLKPRGSINSRTLCNVWFQGQGHDCITLTVKSHKDFKQYLWTSYLGESASKNLKDLSIGTLTHKTREKLC